MVILENYIYVLIVLGLLFILLIENGRFVSGLGLLVSIVSLALYKIGIEKNVKEIARRHTSEQRDNVKKMEKANRFILGAMIIVMIIGLILYFQSEGDCLILSFLYMLISIGSLGASLMIREDLINYG